MKPDPLRGASEQALTKRIIPLILDAREQEGVAGELRLRDKLIVIVAAIEVHIAQLAKQKIAEYLASPQR